MCVRCVGDCGRVQEWRNEAADGRSSEPEGLVVR